MLKKIVVITAIFGFLFSSTLSFAKSEAKPAVSVPPPAKVPNVMPPKKAYTKEEMIAILKKILDDEEEVLNFIPAMKKGTTEKGESFYTYEGMKLEDLDKEKLSKVFTRVRQEANRIRTDRLSKQLENIRRNQQLTAIAGGGAPRMPVVPPAPPSVPQPPRPPATPPAPPSVPQPPRPPATPHR